MAKMNKYKQILGINRRNQEYIRPHNPPSAKKISDNKILCKKILHKADIKTPKTIKIIRNKRQLETLAWQDLPKSFVVKPNRGTGGNSIIVFYGQKKGKLSWIKSNHQVMTKEQIGIHFEKILDGVFSMGDTGDVVVIEERILNHPTLRDYSFRGVPDIRLIIFNRVPVMAMARFPTKMSEGKANLHAGGICTGIDLANGLTTESIQLKKRSILENTYKNVEFTSDLKENKPLKGIKIPYWDEILNIAIKCQDITNIGFLGIDIAIDADRGPLVLEVNSRPGLGIQMANNSGLRPKLEKLKDMNISSRKRASRLAKTLFGGEIEDEIESLSGKEIVNLVEKITVYHKIDKKAKKEYQTIRALLDTGITTSRIDEGLANRMGHKETIENFKNLGIPEEFKSVSEAKKIIKEYTENGDLNYRLEVITESAKIKVKPVVKTKIKIAGKQKEIETIVSSQKEMIYPILIGNKELKNYLIDASKTFTR